MENENKNIESPEISSDEELDASLTLPEHSSEEEPLFDAPETDPAATEEDAPLALQEQGEHVNDTPENDGAPKVKLKPARHVEEGGKGASETDAGKDARADAGTNAGTQRRNASGTDVRSQKRDASGNTSGTDAGSQKRNVSGTDVDSQRRNISGTSPEQERRYYNAPQKKSKKRPGGVKPGWIIGAVCGIAAVIGIGVTVATASPTLNMDKYTTTEFTGYDGYGTAKVEVDWTRIQHDFAGKIKYTKEAQAQFKKAGEAFGYDGNLEDIANPSTLLPSTIGVDIDSDSNGKLSNGDKVTVKYDVPSTLSQALRLKVKAKDKVVTVKGLKKAEGVDVFEKVNLEFTGANGDGYASIKNSTDGYGEYFSLDKTSSLSNGDKVTVTLKSPDSFIQQFGMKPLETSKEYTVSGLAEYVSKVSSLSETALEALKTQASDVIVSTYANQSSIYDYTGGSPEYVGTYVLYSKDNDNSWYGNAKCKVGLIYKVVLTGTREEGSWSKANVGLTQTVYRNVVFDNILIDGDGNLKEDLGSSGNIHDSSYRSDVLDDTVYGYDSLETARQKIIDGNAAEYTGDWQITE